MHSYDLVHVDIKPANIFVTRDGVCKLGDFGLVFDLNKVSGFLSLNWLEFILFQDDPNDAIEGDSKYLAKEVLNDKPTKAADIFSLGMTILELATDLDLPCNGVFWHNLRQRIIDEKYVKRNILNFFILFVILIDFYFRFITGLAKNNRVDDRSGSFTSTNSYGTAQRSCNQETSIQQTTAFDQKSTCKSIHSVN